MSTLKNIGAKHVAEFFIAKSQDLKKPVTNKKLQKLLYYSQAWSVTLKDKKLFKEKIEAWIHGPAIREIYLAYKNFGFQPITKVIDQKILDEIPEDTKKFLEEVWDVYGKYDAQYLELLTHSEDPWKKARQGIESDIGSNQEISIKDMKEFYSKLQKDLASKVK